MPSVKFSYCEVFLLIVGHTIDATDTMLSQVIYPIAPRCCELSSALRTIKMASALMHDQWADSPPTFQSVYRFSILPQSQIKQDYYRGRRLGDVSRSSRRSLVDEDFVKTQNLLARGQYVAPKERNERRCRNKSRRRERTASDKEQSNTKVPTPTTKSSLASQSTLSDFHWHEVLRKVILFTIALLLCAPSTLQPIAEQDIHGSAAKTDSFEGIRYELVPDRRRWGEYYFCRIFDHKTRR